MTSIKDKFKYRIFQALGISILLLSALSQLSAQDFIPGETYLDSSEFVRYRAGNIPIILSAPHGGSLTPDSIPDRSFGTFGKDLWTMEIANAVYDEIIELTGCYPHLVINLLHRIKFDANRDLEEAADGNPHVQQAWRGYHRFITTAKDSISVDGNRGVFFDVHGHGHTIQRMELGYLLNKNDLENADADLDLPAFVDKCALRALVSNNELGATHAELLRGDFSFGSILEYKGFPATPSAFDPMPGVNNPFFSGGYNTVRHGSRDNQGSIDAIQIEMNQSIRFDELRRAELIDSLALSMLDFLSLHYPESGCLDKDQDDDGFDYTVDCDDTNPDINPDAIEIPNNGIDEDCDGMDLLSSNEELEHQQFKISPNPASNFLNIRSTEKSNFKIVIFNTCGSKVLERQNQNRIDCSHLLSGSYVLRITDLDKGAIFYHMIFIE